jgi:ornithine cyclodeaminase/alanine dehydrogenase-like protein (mu-crystallin family)
MLMIDNEVVKRVLTMRECIEAQERAFRGTLTGASVSRPRLDMFVPCDREDGYYRWGSVEGASDGVLAVRLKSDIIAWPEAADGTRTETKYCMKPGTYCGLVLLFSTRDGEPLAIINDGYLQHMRVGASAGIGARLLAREDAEAVGMIGSGGMARTTLEALVEVRDIRSVKVYSRSAANREAFAAEMREHLKLQVEPVASAREAVRGADILATCTDSMHPVVEGGWIEPGMHVVNIGPSDLGPDALARMEVVVRQGVETLPMAEDDVYRKGVGHSRGAFVGGSPEEQKRLPMSSSKGGAARPPAPLYVDVISGKAPGRTSRDQISQYRPVGNWGLQFSSVGGLVYRRAKEQGLGRKLPTEWFLQDIKN